MNTDKVRILAFIQDGVLQSCFCDGINVELKVVDYDIDNLTDEEERENVFPLVHPGSSLDDFKHEHVMQYPVDNLAMVTSKELDFYWEQLDDDKPKIT